ncbi:BTAD domain-containing putative transcriptional regulator [Streptomyces carpaticus]|uniref:BTAD domain-containing putative transcriptional regulator n=1 Tax=Streptomyces carpaticus TaxID=285558 RepID=UPI0031F8E187
MRVDFEVLGPVTARDAAGRPIPLKGPRHRAVLARLLVARRRVVPVPRLVADLWEDEPPAGAVPALRTFVAALRRALEPDRPPRTPARLLVTEGPGYALRADPGTVDAERFSSAVAAATTPDALAAALALWRGPAYADVADAPWARAERTRLGELRLHAVERRAALLLDRGSAAEAVPDLDAHVTEHPWREDGWRLLALALYRSGRQGDALAVLRRARTLLVEQLGVDPGPALRRLEADILAQAGSLAGGGTVERVWEETAAAYDRTVAGGSRARLESTVGLLRELALTGGAGLLAARGHRPSAVAAAEELGDPELTARVIGAYDVPAIWTRVDDPEQAARVVAAAERTLAALPPDAAPAARARLLATIAVEVRGAPTERAGLAAQEAVALARELGDARLLAFALNGLFMQTFDRAGLAGRRDGIGAELVVLAARHGLPAYEILGHLIRMQAHAARGDFPGADRHAAAADRLAERHDRPLVAVFTQWYAALRRAERGPVAEAEAAYRAAAERLSGAGMPGLERGLLPLALLCLRIRHGLPWEDPAAAGEEPDWGPYAPWTRPLLLLARGADTEAAAALRALPPPPRDLLYEAMWCLTAKAAAAVGDRETLHRARTALAPAAGELAGAGSGLLTLGPVTGYL